MKLSLLHVMAGLILACSASGKKLAGFPPADFPPVPVPRADRRLEDYTDICERTLAGEETCGEWISDYGCETVWEDVCSQDNPGGDNSIQVKDACSACGDDDCEAGTFNSVYCDGGNLIGSQQCDSTCGSCSVHQDYTALSDGVYYCDDTYYYVDSDGDGAADETNALPGCYYEDCGSEDDNDGDADEADDQYWGDWAQAELYNGDTDTYGDELHTTITTASWSREYELYIAFTMPDDLSEIGDWAGLLGNDAGGHPYPYFNSAGLFYERQNGPHPGSAYIGMDFFEAGESYRVGFYHDGDGCFRMWSEHDTDSEVSWCYQYSYSQTPVYAGCGYGPGQEPFPGSVTYVEIHGYIEIQDSSTTVVVIGSVEYYLCTDSAANCVCSKAKVDEGHCGGVPGCWTETSQETCEEHDDLWLPTVNQSSGDDMGDLDVDCDACCDERRRRLRGGRQLLFGQISDAACGECVC